MRFVLSALFLLLSLAAIYAMPSGEDTSPLICNANCPKILAPVCGRNNKGTYRLFPNQCILEFAQCQYPNKGYVEVPLVRCFERLALN